jgi:hypothetical protein
LLARGEFSIIVNVTIAGSLMSVLQPFAALYVLIFSERFAAAGERVRAH